VLSIPISETEINKALEEFDKTAAQIKKGQKKEDGVLQVRHMRKKWNTLA
jgi:hypothetical protein